MVHLYSESTFPRVKFHPPPSHLPCTECNATINEMKFPSFDKWYLFYKKHKVLLENHHSLSISIHLPTIQFIYFGVVRIVFFYGW